MKYDLTYLPSAPPPTPNRIVALVRRRNAWLWFAFGALCSVRLNFVGEVYLGELLAIAVLPILVLTRKVRTRNAWLVIAGAAFSLAQLISDIYNQTQFDSAVKGILAPTLFCLVILCFTTLFERDTRRVWYVLAGVVLGKLVQVAVLPNEYQQFQPWKWGYGHAVLTIGLLWFSVHQTKFFWMTIWLVLFAFVSLLLDARSLGGLPLFGLAAYTLWRSANFKSLQRWLLRGRGAIKLVVLVLPLAVVANWLLSLLFLSDAALAFVDPTAASKYRQQAQSDVGLLLAGRSEWLVSIQAFVDSPIIGHGSWAEDDGGRYLNDYRFLREKYGITDSVAQEYRLSLIPAHSFIFGAMVWAGLAGGAFWMFFAYRVLARYLADAKNLPIYFHVGIVFFTWDLLFSPFAAQSRWSTAIFVSCLLAATSLASSRFTAKGRLAPTHL